MSRVSALTRRLSRSPDNSPALSSPASSQGQHSLPPQQSRSSFSLLSPPLAPAASPSPSPSPALSCASSSTTTTPSQFALTPSATHRGTITSLIMGEHPVSVSIPEPVHEPVFINCSHQARAFAVTKMLESMYRTQTLTDFEIVVRGSTKFLVHRIALAAASDYYRQQFEGVWSDSATMSHELEADVDPKIVGQLLDIVYCGQAHVAPQDIVSLLQLSDRLGFLLIRQSCVQELVQRMDVENCVVMLGVGEALNSVELCDAAKQFIRKHLAVVASRDEWLSLSAADMRGILEHDCISVKSEVEVFSIVLRWLKHQKHTPAECFEALSCVRFGTIPIHTLGNLVSPCLNEFNEDPRTKQLLLDSFVFHVTGQAKQLDRSITTHRSTTSKLFMLGSVGDVGTSRVHSFCYVNVASTTLSPLLCPAREIHDDTGVCILDGRVFCSGRKIQFDSASVSMYDEASNSWKDLPPLKIPRMLIGLCGMKGNLFAIGGVSGSQDVTKTVEMFDRSTGYWIVKRELCVPGVWAASAVLGDILYVVLVPSFLGGNERGKLVSYDYAKDSWTLESTVPFKATRYRICAVDNDLFVVGCDESPTAEADVFCFSTEEKKWTEMAKLPVEYCRNVCVCNGMLTAVCQQPKDMALKTLWFDRRLAKWTQGASLPVLEQFRAVKWILASPP